MSNDDEWSPTGGEIKITGRYGVTYLGCPRCHGLMDDHRYSTLADGATFVLCPAPKCDHATCGLGPLPEETP